MLPKISSIVVPVTVAVDTEGVAFLSAVARRFPLLPPVTPSASARLSGDMSDGDELPSAFRSSRFGELLLAASSAFFSGVIDPLLMLPVPLLGVVFANSARSGFRKTWQEGDNERANQKVLFPFFLKKKKYLDQRVQITYVVFLCLQDFLDNVGSLFLVDGNVALKSELEDDPLCLPPPDIALEYERRLEEPFEFALVEDLAPPSANSP